MCSNITAYQWLDLLIKVLGGSAILLAVQSYRHTRQHAFADRLEKATAVLAPTSDRPLKPIQLLLATERLGDFAKDYPQNHAAVVRTLVWGLSALPQGSEDLESRRTSIQAILQLVLDLSTNLDQRDAPVIVGLNVDDIALRLPAEAVFHFRKCSLQNLKLSSEPRSNSSKGRKRTTSWIDCDLSDLTVINVDFAKARFEGSILNRIETIQTSWLAANLAKAKLLELKRLPRDIEDMLQAEDFDLMDFGQWKYSSQPKVKKFLEVFPKTRTRPEDDVGPIVIEPTAPPNFNGPEDVEIVGDS
jgi:hypothetical protein